jgi:methylated-DNA-[protein]-cysteine S-methyltransferase
MASNPAIYSAVLCTPVAMIGVQCDGESLLRVDFLPETTPERPLCNPVAKNAARQLERYFRDPQWRFRLPIRLLGTPFQQKSLWRALGEIDAGQFETYGSLARWLSTGARAAGQACRQNPVPIIVPCHRITGARGLGGYAGDLQGGKLSIKAWTLRHEGVYL